ncbi:MAG: hypothetical protein KDJ52_27545 [Anaerolineae bacterium]|nr:hypothetical protein [Anaerolineae bacterium]
MNHKPATPPRLLTLIAVIAGLTALGLLTGLLWPGLVTHAGPTPPPRDEPPGQAPPDNKNDDDDDDDDDAPPGAYIELQMAGDGSGLWAAVQWQDSEGNWQPVEGWQGPLGPGGQQRWWVAAKDFGSGPFRWVVSAEARSTALDGSAAFNLPTAANETVRVTVANSP